MQGFSQIWGIHYDRSHSPCMAHSSLRTILSVASCLDLALEFCDFTSKGQEKVFSSHLFRARGGGSS